MGFSQALYLTFQSYDETKTTSKSVTTTTKRLSDDDEKVFSSVFQSILEYVKSCYQNKKKKSKVK